MTLHDLFPERSEQIDQLRALLASDAPSLPHLLVWGGHKTGKTTIVRGLLEEMERKFVWIRCHRTDSVNHLTSSIARDLSSQLQLDTAVIPRSSKSPSGFIHYLSELLSPDGPTWFIVLEHPETLTNKSLVGLFMEEKPFTRRWTVIFISHSANEWLPDDTRPPIPIAFDSYTSQELISILERELLPFNEHDKISREFIKNVVPILTRSTTDPELLKACFHFLFQRYWQPVMDREEQKEVNVRELNSRVMEYVHIVLKTLSSGQLSDIRDVFAHFNDDTNRHANGGDSVSDKKDRGDQGGMAWTGVCSTGLPLLSKVAMLAAFICSNSRPENDRIVFDFGETTKRRRLTPGGGNDRKKSTMVVFDYARLSSIAQRLMLEIGQQKEIGALHSLEFHHQFTTLEIVQFIKHVIPQPACPAGEECVE